MLKVIVIAFIILFFGCANDKKYQGPANRIVCLSSKQDMEYVKRAFDKVFSNIIYTPQPENMYDIIYKDFLDFNDFRQSSNLIIASIFSFSDSTVDLYAKRLHNKMDSLHSIFIADDGFTDNQLLVCAFYDDTLSFINGIKDNDLWIRQNFNRQIKRNIISSYKNKDQNDSLKNVIQNKFNLDLIVHHDYSILDYGNDYIWIGRGSPYRWIIVQELDYKDTYDFIDIQNNLNSITKMDSMMVVNSIDGISDSVIKQTYTYKDEKIIDSIKARFFRGLYQYYGTGGPFISYIFTKNNKNILVSSFVNNPGFDKLPMLIQQQAIIENIKILEKK